MGKRDDRLNLLKHIWVDLQLQVGVESARLYVMDARWRG